MRNSPGYSRFLLSIAESVMGTVMIFGMIALLWDFDLVGYALFVPGAICFFLILRALKKRTEPFTAGQKRILFVIQILLVSLIPITFLIAAFGMGSRFLWAICFLSTVLVLATVYACYLQLFVHER